VIRLDARSQRINSALATADCFRNINGVYMKLMNFGAYPFFRGGGRGGASPTAAARDPVARGIGT